MAIPSDGFIQIVWNFNNSNGETAQMVQHAAYDLNGGTDNNQLINLIGELVTRFAPFLGPAMSSNCDLVGFTVYIWNAVTQLWDNAGIGTDTVLGESTQRSSPSGAAMLMKILTNNPRVVGKKYVPGLTTGMLGATGQLDGTTVANGLNLALAMFDNLTTANGDLSPGVWSKKNKAFEPSTQSFEVNTPASYQRRRREGVGI